MCDKTIEEKVGNRISCTDEGQEGHNYCYECFVQKVLFSHRLRNIHKNGFTCCSENERTGDLCTAVFDFRLIFKNVLSEDDQMEAIQRLGEDDLSEMIKRLGYTHIQKALTDLDIVIARYTDEKSRRRRCLKPACGPLMLIDDDKNFEAQLVFLRGVLPIFHRGQQYNTPVEIYLPLDYPASPPLIYVRPTPDFVAFPRHPFVNSDGLVNDLPLLRDWKQSKGRNARITTLLDAVQIEFGEMPPLYVKPSNYSPEMLVSEDESMDEEQIEELQTEMRLKQTKDKEAVANKNVFLKLKPGFLSFFSSWEERFVYCDDDVLVQFHDGVYLQPDERALTHKHKVAFTAPLKVCRIERATQLRAFAFVVTYTSSSSLSSSSESKQKKVTLAAKDEGTYNSWMRHFEKHGLVNNFSNVKSLEWAKVRIDSSVTNKRSTVLGSGTFSDVYKARFDVGRGDWRDVAIKVLKQEEDDYPRLCDEAFKEADIIASVTNRMFDKSGIVTLYGVAQGTLTPELSSFFNIRDGQSRVGLVLGYEPTSLHKVLYASSFGIKLLSVNQKISLVKSLTNALRNLHNANCIHGDLKPQNILLSGDVGNFQVKLADFNISDLREGREMVSTKSKSSILQLTKSFRGTKAYCAVEQLPDPRKPNAQVAKASRGTDIFSLGVVIWEIFSGKPPHYELGNNEVALSVKLYNNGRPSDPSVNDITEMPEALRDMVKQCWHVDRSSRPTAVECHSVISQIANVVSEKSFDIFFSHCWVDKEFLSHVYTLLTDIGFRVWYDMNEMGWNLDKSMIDGVAQSKVFLCCFNKTYETRTNCLFELRECKKRHPEKPVIALIMEDMYDKKKSWNVKQECKDMLKLGLQRGNNMYCDLSKLASNSAWKDPSLKDCIPEELMLELGEALKPLTKILNDVKCYPSFGPKTGGGSI